MARTILLTACALFVALCVACAGRPGISHTPATTPPPEYLTVAGDVIVTNAQRGEALLLTVAPGKPGESIDCYFREEEEVKLLRIKDGQRITVRGRFAPAKKTGQFTERARLEDCTVQD